MTVRGKTLPGAMQYLNKMVKQRSLINDQLDIADLVEALEHAAARLVKKAALRVQSLMKNGVAEEDARNQSGVLLVNAAKAHSRAFTVRTFAEIVERSVLDPDIFKVMHTLCKLFAAHGMVTNMGDFLQDGYMSSQQAEMLMNKQLELYTEVRPNAVALVDAYDYPDHVLQSCLGRYDGNVYEALYEYAKQSPLNKSDVLDSYHSTLRPLIRGKLFNSTATSKL